MRATIAPAIIVIIIIIIIIVRASTQNR